MRTDLPSNSAPATTISGTSPHDLDAATRAARDLLTALGVPTDCESRCRTPERMAKAFIELLTAEPFDLTTFPNNQEYRQLILEREIPFASLCEHHMMPFQGQAHVAYLPGRRILGLSKLARVVDMFARRPQTQEAMTQQVANWLNERLTPAGVGVVIEAEHTCMTLRGARARGAFTVTSALHGALLSDGRARNEFFSLTGVGV